MSDPLAKAERSKAKDKRQIPPQDSEVKTQKGKRAKKPYKLMRRIQKIDGIASMFYGKSYIGAWITVGNYKRMRDAEQALDAACRQDEKYAHLGFGEKEYKIETASDD